MQSMWSRARWRRASCPVAVPLRRFSPGRPSSPLMSNTSRSNASAVPRRKPRLILLRARLLIGDGNHPNTGKISQPVAACYMPPTARFSATALRCQTACDDAQGRPEALRAPHSVEEGIMDVILRPGRPEDADACGTIVFEAFKSIASRHNFPLDIPSADIGIGLVTKMLSHPGFYSLIAEKDGTVVGSLFLDERGSIAAVSPLTISPATQNQTIGRRLMLAALERTVERRFAGVRLVQSAYHYRALCLYAKL